MSLIRPFARAALALAAAAALSGCISVFPKSDPAHLYRFGAADPPEGAAVSATAPVIGSGTIGFDSAAASDRILTITGSSAAYIEAARWVSPAPVLFEEALFRAFRSTPGAPRLTDRRNALRSPLIMNLEVQNFEARYDQGAEAAPQVVVRVRAVLIRTQDRAVVAEDTFTAASRAADNRQGPIVDAYDAAVTEALGKLIAWAGQNAR